ncbi:MAG: TenA family transcriptional regulator, partial [Bryobacteraceae bacterium]
MQQVSWSDSELIRRAGDLWKQATDSSFLQAIAAGSLPEDAFRRWLCQDYLFALGLTSFQAVALAKAPRDAHRVLIGGLVALDNELEWFEMHA